MASNTSYNLQRDAAKLPTKKLSTEASNEQLSLLDDSKYVLQKMRKDNIAIQTSAKTSKSVYTNDFQMHAIKMLQDNLAGKLIAAKNTPEKRQNCPSLYTNSTYGSHYEKQAASRPKRELGGDNSILFGQVIHVDHSTYQALHGVPKNVLDDTVKPIKAPELIVKNPAGFRGQSTYGAEYAALPKIKLIRPDYNQDHLMNSSLGKEVFRSSYKENFQSKHENGRDSRVQLVRPNDNSHFFPQGHSNNNGARNLQQKHYKKSRYR